MKKTIRTMLLTLAVAAASAAAVFSSGQNTVISLSYLNGTYMSQLTSGLQGSLTALDDAYQAALNALAEKTGQGQTDPTLTSTAFFQSVYPRAGETVTLAAGSGLIWHSGSASASALLLDVTAGAELPAGSALTAGHRYLAEQAVVITASSSSSCGAEGLWSTTATGTAPVQSPFRDVSLGDWYYDAVMYTVEHGLFSGTSATTFSPDDDMSRAMLVTVLYRLAGKPPVTGTMPFTDVEEDTWYSAAVLWAAQTGVATGSTATTFAPNTPISREQFAVMLYRYSLYYGYDTSGRASVDGFSDGGKVSGFAQDGVSWAVSIGLLQGSANQLLPTGSASRSQVATMLQRYQLWLG